MLVEQTPFQTEVDQFIVFQGLILFRYLKIWSADGQFKKVLQIVYDNF